MSRKTEYLVTDLRGSDLRKYSNVMACFLDNYPEEAALYTDKMRELGKDSLFDVPGFREDPAWEAAGKLYCADIDEQQNRIKNLVERIGKIRVERYVGQRIYVTKQQEGSVVFKELLFSLILMALGIYFFVQKK